jgi:hypothetical protein
LLAVVPFQIPLLELQANEDVGRSRDGEEQVSGVSSSKEPPCPVYRFRPWLADMSQLEDGFLSLPCSPRYGDERRVRCAFQPMPMRCARLNEVLPAEEFVELTRSQPTLLLIRLRLSTRS